MKTLLVSVVAILSATALQAQPARTATAADRCEPGLPPGCLGKTEIETPIPGHPGDQYWTDSDGVDPAVAGCHFPFSRMTPARACSGPLAPAGVFGEFCNPAEGDPMHQAGYPVGALIESNPAAGVCHPHKDQKGHPYVYDCDAFCKGTQTRSHTGRCVAAACNADRAIASARCECTAG